MPGAAVQIKLEADTHEADVTGRVMPRGVDITGCPRLDKGHNSCWYGCTRGWPMCHMFQDNKCYAQHRHEFCSKGWHVRENDRRTIDYDEWQDVPSTREPRRKKRRRATKTELELRLRRLGFFNSKLPPFQDLETAYTLYKNTVEASAIADEDKRLNVRKLRSAFKNISKAIQGEVPEPSSTDSDDASLERESAAEQAS